MRCLSCQNFSFEIICNRCKNELLKVNIEQKMVGEIEVISLFPYSEIEKLILTKYKSIGSRVYKYFSQKFIKEFLKSFQASFRNPIYIVGIDEHPKDIGFSHTSILAHFGTSKNVKHLKASLIAKNRVTYAGKSRDFRLLNRRNFEYKGLQNIDIVLIDDIITTGATLNEAKDVIESSGASIIFALVLADAKR